MRQFKSEKILAKVKKKRKSEKISAKMTIIVKDAKNQFDHIFCKTNNNLSIGSKILNGAGQLGTSFVMPHYTTLKIAG